MAVANWKLNGDISLIDSMSIALNSLNIRNVEVVVCPSYVYLPLISERAQNFSVGSQNMSEHLDGAYTGEVSTQMLKAFSVKYVIIGHSERRTIFNESNALIADKFCQAIEQGLIPILCVGETEKQRDEGQTEAVIASQLEAVIDKAGIAVFAKAVIAYEPVWAIGTGKTATAELAQAVHLFIRHLLAGYDAAVSENLAILYGGSVTAANCEALFVQADIDGGLIGGASLKIEEFMAICRGFKGNT
jgi:triosephosphate isomerase